MRSNIIRLGLCLLMLSSFSIPQISQADFFLHHWEDHYEPFRSTTLEADLMDYMSSENFDAYGNRFSPPGFNGYNRLEGDINGQVGLLDDLSLFGRISFAHFSLDTSALSSTTNGLTDQTAGFTYRVYQSNIDRGNTTATAVDLQVQADIPAYGNGENELARSPDQGDGSLDLTFGAFVFVPAIETSARLLSLTGGVGYTHRSNHFSSQFLSSLTGSFTPKKSGWLASASFFEVSSLNTDTSTPSQSAGGFLTGSGGSYITGDINSSTTILRGQIGYQLDSGAQLLASVEQTVFGEYAPAATNLIFGFKMTFGKDGGREGGQGNEHVAYSKTTPEHPNYSLQSHVTKTNDRLNLIKIDKGSNSGVATGQIFDIFTVRSDGLTGEPIARCQVENVKTEEAALKVMEYFKEIWIEEGFIAQKLVQ